MKLYRFSTLLNLAMAVILVLATNQPGTAHSLSLNQDSSVEANTTIFLPLLTLSNKAEQNSSVTSRAVPHEYLILWRSETTGVDASILDNAQFSLPYDILDVSSMVGAGLESSAKAILESFRNNSTVELVEPNYIYTSTLIPNDPRQGDQYAWALIGGYETWDLTLGDASTIIAVVDTGVDLDHPDLVSKLVSGFDFVDRDSVADDGNGHGTHVAGTAAAGTDNERDGAGTCPNCAIMPVRALNDEGTGSLADIAAAITFAANNGADVINLSLGSSARSNILEQAVSQAWDSGVFVTCAAGNSNSGQPEFPAGFDKCVSVASTTETDQRSSFSNFGSSVELAAPGSNILSTTPNTADAVAGTGELWQCGRINMLRAVSADGPNQEPTPTPTPTASPTPQPTETPSSPWSQPLVDGGFENGSSGHTRGWSYSDPGIRSSERPASGRYSASLGGENDSTDLIEQRVVIPAGGRLSYLWIANSSDSGKNSYPNSQKSRLDVGDRLVLELELLDSPGATLILRHPPRQQKWNRTSVDVSEFAGQSVTVRFRAETNRDSPTTFYVDDVELE